MDVMQYFITTCVCQSCRGFGTPTTLPSAPTSPPDANPWHYLPLLLTGTDVDIGCVEFLLLFHFIIYYVVFVVYLDMFLTFVTLLPHQSQGYPAQHSWRSGTYCLPRSVRRYVQLHAVEHVRPHTAVIRVNVPEVHPANPVTVWLTCVQEPCLLNQTATLVYTDYNSMMVEIESIGEPELTEDYQLHLIINTIT